MGSLSIEARYLEPEIPEELGQTYRRTFARLKGLFRARGCTPEEAADLAQEAAMRAYMHVQRWGVTGEGLDPLINRIARNLLIDRHRRVSPHLVPLDNAYDVQDPADDPTEEVIRRQRSVEVQTAVGELPDRHQTAILYSMNGMTPAEVGNQLGIGRNAADALLHRARRSLRERLRHVGEGAYGLAFWLRVKARNGAAKAGFRMPADGAAAGVGLTTTVAAAAVIVAAINIATPHGGSAHPASISRQPAVGAVLAGGGASGNGTGSGSGPTTPGGWSRGVSIGGGAAGVGGGNHHVGGHASVPNPANPSQQILGVAPDVIHEDNGSSVVGDTYDQACGDAADCSALYRDPIQPYHGVKP